MPVKGYDIDNIKSREGFSKSIYKDTRDFETIGYGHKLSKAEKKSGKIHGYDYSKGLTEEQGAEIAKKDADVAKAGAGRVLKKMGITDTDLSTDQRDAVDEMVYQLGTTKTLGFKKTFEHIKNKDYDKAAKEAADSNWNKQTPVRVKDFQDRIVMTKEDNISDLIKKMEEGGLQMGTKKSGPIEEEINAGLRDPMSKFRKQGQKAAAKQQLNEKEQKEFDNIDNDPKRQQEIARRQVQGKGHNSLSESFFGSLGFFMPSVIGGLVGAAFEGGEGALAGIKGAQGVQKMQKDFTTTDKKLAMEQERIDISKQKASRGKIFQPKVDITPDFQIASTKEPVGTREKAEGGFEFIDTKGNVVAADKVESIKLDVQRLRQTETTKRQAIGIAERDEEQTDAAIKTFTKKGDVSKLIMSRDSIDPMVNLLESKIKITDDFIAPFIARGVQKEVGNLSETDLKKARVPLAFHSRIRSDFKGWLQGDMTDEERAATINLLKFMNKVTKKQLSTKLEGYATANRAKRLGMTKEELAIQMGQETGIDIKSRGKSFSERLDNMSPAKRARYEEFKRQRGNK